ncbi:MAG: hypothetical protein WAK98_14195, partial [Gemmobacter sp.]
QRCSSFDDLQGKTPCIRLDWNCNAAAGQRSRDLQRHILSRTAARRNRWILIVTAPGANVTLNLFLKKGGRGLDTMNIGTLILSILGSARMWMAVISATDPL